MDGRLDRVGRGGEAVAGEQAHAFARHDPHSVGQNVDVRVVGGGVDRGIGVDDQAGGLDRDVRVGSGQVADLHLVGHVVANCDAHVAVDRVDRRGRRGEQAAGAGEEVDRAQRRRGDVHVGAEVDGARGRERDVPGGGFDVGVGLREDVGARSGRPEQDVARAVRGDRGGVGGVEAVGQRQVARLRLDHDRAVRSVGHRQRGGGLHVGLAHFVVLGRGRVAVDRLHGRAGRGVVQAHDVADDQPVGLDHVDAV